MLLRNFKGSIVFTSICLALGAWYGWSESGSMVGMLRVLWIIVVLSVLEISLSFDNAVVNASVLQGMDQVWRKRFLTWGMLIAVFGMRIIFPLAVVAIAASLNPIEAIRLSLGNPAEYERIVSSAHTGIAGFGGAFLAMVGLKFFFDADKDVHWIGIVERWLSRFGTLPAVEMVAVLMALVGISSALPLEGGYKFLLAGVFGIISFVLVDGLGHVLALREERLKAAGVLVKSGLGGFLYLNVLDASFSFDGVIGAFALSNNMVVIALGLSIGAMFVRTITIMLVREGTLSQYRYLEHGAFWAILALGGIMLASVLFHIPDAVTGLVGAALIGLALWRSVRHNRKYPD